MTKRYRTTGKPSTLKGAKLERLIRKQKELIIAFRKAGLLEEADEEMDRLEELIRLKYMGEKED